MDGVIGYTTLFAGTFAPRSWMLCLGQTITIQSNTALFSILGTTYGGNGTSTFMLPNLQGRAVVGAGQGAGLSNYVLGQVGGVESVTLNVQQLPAHVHPVSYTINQAAAATSSLSVATNNTYGNDDSGGTTPYGSPANVGLKPFSGNIAMNASGLGQPISTINPLMALNYIICVFGLFPSRN